MLASRDRRLPRDVMCEFGEASRHYPDAEQAGDAARDDRELWIRDGGHDAGLDVAEARAAGHDEGMDRGHAAAQAIGRVELDERRSEDRREDVGGAGRGKEDEGERE